MNLQESANSIPVSVTRSQRAFELVATPGHLCILRLAARSSTRHHADLHVRVLLHGARLPRLEDVMGYEADMKRHEQRHRPRKGVRYVLSDARSLPVDGPAPSCRSPVTSPVEPFPIAPVLLDRRRRSAGAGRCRFIGDRHRLGRHQLPCRRLDHHVDHSRIAQRADGRRAVRFHVSPGNAHRRRRVVTQIRLDRRHPAVVHGADHPYRLVDVGDPLRVDVARISGAQAAGDPRDARPPTNSSVNAKEAGAA